VGAIAFILFCLIVFRPLFGWLSRNGIALLVQMAMVAVVIWLVDGIGAIVDSLPSEWQDTADSAVTTGLILLLIGVFGLFLHRTITRGNEPSL